MAPQTETVTLSDKMFKSVASGTKKKRSTHLPTKSTKLTAIINEMSQFNFLHILNIPE